MKQAMEEERGRPDAAPETAGKQVHLGRSRKKERRLFYWVCVWAAFSGLACCGVYAVRWQFKYELSHPKPGLHDPFEYEGFLFAYAFYMDVALGLLALFTLIMIIVMIRWLMTMKRNRQMV